MTLSRLACLLVEPGALELFPISSPHPADGCLVCASHPSGLWPSRPCGLARQCVHKELERV